MNISQDNETCCSKSPIAMGRASEAFQAFVSAIQSRPLTDKELELLKDLLEDKSLRQEIDHVRQEMKAIRASISLQKALNR